MDIREFAREAKENKVKAEAQREREIIRGYRYDLGKQMDLWKAGYRDNVMLFVDEFHLDLVKEIVDEYRGYGFVVELDEEPIVNVAPFWSPLSRQRYLTISLPKEEV